MPRADLSRLNKLCDSIPEILGMWVFGSAKDGNVPSGSDMDLAVLFKHKPSFDLLTDLRGSLQKAIGIDEVDLVVLNDSSSILRFEAVRGRLIFCRDRDQCAGFASLAAREYESDLAMIEKHVVDHPFQREQLDESPGNV